MRLFIERTLQRNKPYIVFVILVSTALAFAWLLYLSLAPKLIEQMFQGDSFPAFNRMIEGRAVHDLQYYLNRGHHFMCLFSVAVIILAIFCFPIYLLFRESWKRGVRDLIIIAITTFFLFEGLLRLILFVDFFAIEKLRNSELYAHKYADENYFKLRKKWNQGHQRDYPLNVRVRYDPFLGWAPEKTPENPLGVVEKLPYTAEKSRPTILFYGNSYVEGETQLPDKIPQVLDKLIASHKVYNYGVSGYGVDQIYLRFQRSHPQFENPIIILGIYPTNLERSVLTYRQKPKPYFRQINNELVLKGIPPPEVTEAWKKKNPVTIKSYVLAYLQQLKQRLKREEHLYRQDEIKELNAKIIEAMLKEVKTHNLRCIFVIFGKGTWRKDFLKENFKLYGAPYFDAYAHLEAYAEKHNLDMDQLKLPIGRHPSEIANVVMAKGIQEYLQKELNIN